MTKCFPAFHGAAILVNNDRIVDPVKLGASHVIESKCAMPVSDLAESLVRNLATVPWIYRCFTLPLMSLRDFLQLQVRNFRPVPATVPSNKQAVVPHHRFYTREFHPYQAELLLRMFRRLDKIREQIGRIATVYREVFENTPIRTIPPPGCDNAGLLRSPIAFPGKDRAEIMRLAVKRGLALRVYWDRPLPENSEHKRFPNAVCAAQNFVYLPLYAALSLESARLLAQEVVELEGMVLGKLLP